MAKIQRLHMIVAVGFITLVSLFMSFQGGIVVFAVALLLAAITGSFMYLGHILTPLITKIMNITYTKGEYIFPPGQEVVLKKYGNKYLAAKFMMVNIPEREEVAGKGEERADVYLADFETALGAIKVPVKFSLVLSAKDIGAYRESVQARVYEYSLRIKREMEKAEPDIIKIDKWQKEKDVYENLLRRLASGVKPMAAVMYIMTVAKGVTPKEAKDRAISQGKEIKAVVSNNLNAEVVDLIGEDAELCLEWEFSIPATYQEYLEATG